MKASEELSIDYNNNPVGLHGGKNAGRDLVQPGDNELKSEHVEAANQALDKGTKSSWTGWNTSGKGSFIDRKE